jgi:hypothetical protein
LQAHEALRLSVIKSLIEESPDVMCDSFCNNSIPTSITGGSARYATEICQKESSGSEQRLVFSKFDAAELEPLFTPGTFLDAFFSLDPYDYQQNAGIRLVAKKLIIHSN